MPEALWTYDSLGLLVVSAVIGLYADFKAGKDAPGFWWNLIMAVLYFGRELLVPLVHDPPAMTALLCRAQANGVTLEGYGR